MKETGIGGIWKNKLWGERGREGTVEWGTKKCTGRMENAQWWGWRKMDPRTELHIEVVLN